MEYDIFEKFALLAKEDQAEVLSEVDACLLESLKGDDEQQPLLPPELLC